MSPRLPQQDQFPADLRASVIPPSGSKPACNILILLHGIGDTADNFKLLGQRLNLPETACLAVQAPTPLPFDIGGFHWGDDIVFDQSSGQMDLDTGFERATRLLAQTILQEVLIDKCGWRPRQIMFLGLGQGAMAALATAKASNLNAHELGGIVSFGGSLPAGVQNKDSMNKTPILVLHGSSKSLITVATAKTLKTAFDSVRFHEWKRPGDGMPTSREEMLPVMQFFASRLRSTAGVPAGAQELT